MGRKNEETGKITVSIPGDETDLLEDVDELVEEGTYEDRTEVFQEAIDRLTGRMSEQDRELVLYDAAVSSLYAAEREGKDEIAENARQHIEEMFPGSGIARYLREE